MLTLGCLPSVVSARASGPPTQYGIYLARMSEFLKANESEAAYFVTLTVVDWIDVFTRKVYVDIVLHNLEHCRATKGLEIFAYVVMPSHLHLIVRRKEGLLSDVLRDFKSFTAKRLLEAIRDHPQESRKEWMLAEFGAAADRSAQNAHLMFWQKTSHPEELYSPAYYDQKAEYIRNNPVEAGFVTEPEHYAWISAHADPILKPDAEWN